MRGSPREKTSTHQQLRVHRKVGPELSGVSSPPPSSPTAGRTEAGGGVEGGGLTEEQGGVAPTSLDQYSYLNIFQGIVGVVLLCVIALGVGL